MSKLFPQTLLFASAAFVVLLAAPSSAMPPEQGCGDGYCSLNECGLCLDDCTGAEICGGGCGDGLCGSGETCSTCASDCGSCATPTCGNNLCETGESCSTCAADCGACPTCGNGSCEIGEDCTTCASDCGPCGVTCGNTLCEANYGENCNTCFQDCGPCDVNCGNGTCQMGETCTNCPMDCHNCTPTSDVCNHNHTCEFGWESCSFCSDCCLGGGDGGWYSQCDGDYNCKGGYKCSHYEGYCVAEWLLQE